MTITATRKTYDLQAALADALPRITENTDGTLRVPSRSDPKKTYDITVTSFGPGSWAADWCRCPSRIMCFHMIAGEEYKRRQEEHKRIEAERLEQERERAASFPRYATGYSAIEQYYDLFDPGYVNDYSYQRANR